MALQSCVKKQHLSQLQKDYTISMLITEINQNTTKSVKTVENAKQNTRFCMAG